MNLDNVINAFLREIPNAISKAETSHVAFACEIARDTLVEDFLGRDITEAHFKCLAFIFVTLNRFGAAPPGWPTTAEWAAKWEGYLSCN